MSDIYKVDTVFIQEIIYAPVNHYRRRGVQSPASSCRRSEVKKKNNYVLEEIQFLELHVINRGIDYLFSCSSFFVF